MTQSTHTPSELRQLAKELLDKYSGDLETSNYLRIKSAAEDLTLQAEILQQKLDVLT